MQEMTNKTDSYIKATIGYFFIFLALVALKACFVASKVNGNNWGLYFLYIFACDFLLFALVAAISSFRLFLKSKILKLFFGLISIAISFFYLADFITTVTLNHNFSFSDLIKFEPYWKEGFKLINWKIYLVLVLVAVFYFYTHDVASRRLKSFLGTLIIFVIISSLERVVLISSLPEISYHGRMPYFSNFDFNASSSIGLDR